jgi:hypothetical protein
MRLSITGGSQGDTCQVLIRDEKVCVRVVKERIQQECLNLFLSFILQGESVSHNFLLTSGAHSFPPIDVHTLADGLLNVTANVTTSNTDSSLSDVHSTGYTARKHTSKPNGYSILAHSGNDGNKKSKRGDMQFLIQGAPSMIPLNLNF